MYMYILTVSLTVYACAYLCTQWWLCGMCIVCTCTVEAVAFKTLSTCAVEAAHCVSTVGIGIACMYLQFTLIDICTIRQMNKCAWT